MINKADLAEPQEVQSVLEAVCAGLENKPEKCFVISGMKGTGVKELCFALQDLVDEVKAREAQDGEEQQEPQEFIWTEPEVRETLVRDDEDDPEDGPEFIFTK